MSGLRKPDWVTTLDSLCGEAGRRGMHVNRYAADEAMITLDCGLTLTVYASIDGYEYEQLGSLEHHEFDGTLEDLL